MGIFDFLFNRKNKERKRQEQIEIQRKHGEERKHQEQIEIQQKQEDERKLQEQIDILRKQEEELKSQELINQNNLFNHLKKNTGSTIESQIKNTKDKVYHLQMKLDNTRRNIIHLQTIEFNLPDHELRDKKLIWEIDILLTEEKKLKQEINLLQTEGKSLKQKISTLKLDKIESKHNSGRLSTFKEKGGDKKESGNRKEYERAYKNVEQIELWIKQLRQCKESDILRGLKGTPSYSTHNNLIHFCERIIKGYQVNGYISIENAGRLKTRIENLMDLLLTEKESKLGAKNKQQEEKQYENSEQQDIRKILEERTIKHLFHFTRLENLSSIFLHGLVPVRLQRKEDIKSINNDEERYDSQLDCTSFSIEFPNYRLFYYFRSKYIDSKWVVIMLDTDILFSPENVAYYCQTNAARLNPKVLNKKELCTAASLENMYSESTTTKENKVITRSELQISDDYTTDPQAEVLISNVISPKHIVRVYFNSDNDVEDYIKKNGIDLLKKFDYMVNPNLFAPRVDYKFWQKENKIG